MPITETDWHHLYCLAKFCWSGFNGLWNRKRIWRDVEEVIGRIKRYREEGEIPLMEYEEEECNDNEGLLD